LWVRFRDGFGDTQFVVNDNIPKKHVLEQADGSDTTSIDSNQRYLIQISISDSFFFNVFYRDGPSVIDRYLKHTRQYLPVKRTDSKE